MTIRKLVVAAIPLVGTCVLFPARGFSADEALGCGPPKEKYRLVRHKDKPMPEPQVGKAMVYVLHEEPWLLRGARFRVGVNGKWVGMPERQSYFYFEPEPGLLKFCLDDSRKTQMFLTAEGGKTHYVLLSLWRVIQISEEEAKKRLLEYHYATAERKR